MLARVAAVVAAIALAAAAYFLSIPPAQPPGVTAAPTVQARAPAPAPGSPVPAPTAAPSKAPQPANPKKTRPSPTPAPSPPPAVEVAPGSAEQRIVGRLQRVLARSQVSGRVSVSVLDSQGRALFGSAPSSQVLPASTQKLAVAAGALARLGPSHRYRTTVTADARPRNGVLRGDLVLVGGADPALSQPVFAAIEPDRPRTRLERLVAQLKRAGVRRVTGRVIGDPNMLAQEPIAAGWPPRYFEQLDATRITGLTVDAGRRVFQANGGLQAEAADDPALQAARVFRKLLRDRGIKVARGARTVARQTSKPVTLAAVSSPPLGRILRYMVQRSDNHFADTVFRTLGAAAGDSTWIGSAQATADALAPLELDFGGVVLADGSGLSRSNRVSATFLAQLHAHMWSSNLHDQWVRLLAISGRSGTLRSRLAGTVGSGRLFGKTGSLRDVVSLVGTVVGTKGRYVHLAVVGNDLQSTSGMRTLTDRAVLAMAEELQDCRRVRPPARGKGKNKRRPPVRLVCG